MNLNLIEERLKNFVLQKLQENDGILGEKENFEITEMAQQLAVATYRIYELKQEAMNEFVEVVVTPTPEESTEKKELISEKLPDMPLSETPIVAEQPTPPTTVMPPPPKEDFLLPVKEEAKIIIKRYLEELVKANKKIIESAGFSQLETTTQLLVKSAYDERKEAYIKAWKWVEANTNDTVRNTYHFADRVSHLSPSENLINVITEMATAKKQAYHLPVSIDHLLPTKPVEKKINPLTTAIAQSNATPVSPPMPTPSRQPVQQWWYWVLGGTITVLLLSVLGWVFFRKKPVYSTDCERNTTQINHYSELAREYRLDFQQHNATASQAYKLRMYDIDANGLFRFDVEGLGSHFQGLHGKIDDITVQLDSLGNGLVEKTKTHYTIRSLRRRPQWTISVQYCR